MRSRTLSLPVLTRDPRADAYPLDRVPQGWYGILTSDALKQGSILNLHYFGRDLVAFRDANGRASVLDAFCPHYGAHLGVRGRIVDGTIECPFHGWRFDGDGACVHAPFAQHAPRAHATALPVREHSGLVFVHAGAGEPSFEPPVIEEHHNRAYAPPIHEVHLARTHIQEMRENIVDESHFHHIHGQERPSVQDIVLDGPFAKVTGHLRKRVLGLMFDNDFIISMYGPGIMVVRTSGRYFTGTTVALTTPVDDVMSEMRLVHFIAKPRQAPYLHPLVRLLFRAVATPEVLAEVEIWDRKMYRPRPVFLAHERGIRTLRSWYAQFYDRAVPMSPTTC